MTSPQLAELTTIIAAYYELPTQVLRGSTAEEITDHAKAIRALVDAQQAAKIASELAKLRELHAEQTSNNQEVKQ